MMHRICTAVLGFGSVILAARVLSTELFATIVNVAFLAKFLLVFNLGATAGYFVTKYSPEENLRSKIIGDRLFFLYFVTQLALMGLLFLLISTLFINQYSLGILAFIFLTPLFALEPILRFKRKFSFSLFPDVILATSLLIVVSVQGIAPFTYSYINTYFATILAGALCVIPFFLRHMLDKGDSISQSNRCLEYKSVLINGFPVYLASAFFLSISSIDRLVLPLHGTPQEVSIYFLSHQLVFGSMIFVTALNFVNTVDIGENLTGHKQISSNFLKDKLCRAILVALPSYGLLIFGTLILQNYFLSEDYRGLTLITVLLGAAYACFFVSNTITPIVAYYKMQTKLTILLGMVALSILANNYWTYTNQLSTVWLASGLATALIAYSLIAIFYTFWVVDKEFKIKRPSSTTQP